jgi:hypothetical protein
MSTVAPEVRGAQPAPPVRHGTCRLTLTIDGIDYRLTRSPTARRMAPEEALGTQEGHRLLRPRPQ